MHQFIRYLINIHYLTFFLNSLKIAHEGDVYKLIDLKPSPKDVNALNKKGTSALHIAARYSHLEIVQELISLGAFIDIEDSESMTPLHYASR